ncbi:MAG TPA: minor capsid protein [Galbitalea sp.]|jgi:hypothetical protein
MSDTQDLLTGVATMISGVASDILWTPNTVGGGIAMKTMPDNPDRIVVLNAIPQTDDAVLPMGNWMIQIAGRGARGNPLDVDGFMDGIFLILHGATNLTFGALHVAQMSRYSSIPMGQDEAVRNIRIDKYSLDLDFPGTAARPASGF